MMMHRSRILVVSGRAVTAGADIPDSRSWLLAAALARSQDVILAVPERTVLSHRDFAVVYYNRHNVTLIAADSDAVVLDAATLVRFPLIVNAGPPVAAGLEAVSARARPGELPGAGIEAALQTADFFFCPDEESRRLWIRALDHAGRVNPLTHRRDAALHRLIGLAAPPAAGGAAAMAPANGGSLSPLAALESFCAAPSYAADRGSEFNRARLPDQAASTGLMHSLRRLGQRLRRSGASGSAARF